MEWMRVVTQQCCAADWRQPYKLSASLALMFCLDTLWTEDTWKELIFVEKYTLIAVA